MERRIVVAKYKDGSFVKKEPLYYLVKALENKGKKPTISQAGKFRTKSWTIRKDTRVLSVIKNEKLDKDGNVYAFDVVIIISEDKSWKYILGANWHMPY